MKTDEKHTKKQKKQLFLYKNTAKAIKKPKEAVSLP